MTLSEFAKFIIQNKLEFLGFLFIPAIAGFCFGYIIWLAASDPLKNEGIYSGNLSCHNNRYCIDCRIMRILVVQCDI